MASKLNPYVSFDGTAREAMEFYRDVFGGELTSNTFGEYGAAEGPQADKIMHSQLATDGDVLRGYWGRLSDGGQVSVPLEKQMWGDEFGMCEDRFGLTWMVNIAGAAQ